MFPKADRKWKIQHGYDVSSAAGGKKLEEERKPLKKEHAPYLEEAKEELKNFSAAEKALRRLNRKGTLEARVSTALEHATDTLVKALVQEAQHTHYEYGTAPAELAMQTSTTEDQVTIDSPRNGGQMKSDPFFMDAAFDEAGAEISCVEEGVDEGDGIESEVRSPSSPVLVWNGTPSKKHQSHEGYIVREEKKKERVPAGISDPHGLELNRVVEVEPTLPSDVKIVKRNGVNLIVSTASPLPRLPPNTETITVTASDLQTCGSDLSMLRACMLKKIEEPEGSIIEIKLNKRYGERLGVSVEFEDLQITSIHPGGVLALWNESNPDRCVRVGSRILEANGKSETIESLREMRDATYATTICLRIECFEGETDGVVEAKEEENVEESPCGDPFTAHPPTIPCCTQNDSYINQVWFPPSPKDFGDDEATPRRPGDVSKRRSDSCPPSPSKNRRQKPSLPPVSKMAYPKSRPRSRESSSAPSSAKGSRDSRPASGSRDSRFTSGSTTSSSERRIASLPRPRSASASRQMSSSSSVEKLPPLA